MSDTIDLLLNRTWLIQRVIPRPEPFSGKKGIDRWFNFDYMGASEFEYGTMFHTVKLMRAQGNLIGIDRISAEVGGNVYRAYFVGRREERKLAELLFEDQLNGSIQDRETRTLERSEISVAYGTDRPKHHAGRLTRVTGWVAVVEKHKEAPFVPFAFFQSERDAGMWLRQLTRPDDAEEH